MTMTVKQVALLFSKLASDPKSAELEVCVIVGEDADELEGVDENSFNIQRAYAGQGGGNGPLLHMLYETEWGKEYRRPASDKTVLVIGTGVPE
jgi:hypothetical protein